MSHPTQHKEAVIREREKVLFYGGRIGVDQFWRRTRRQSNQPQWRKWPSGLYLAQNRILMITNKSAYSVEIWAAEMSSTRAHWLTGKTERQKKTEWTLACWLLRDSLCWNYFWGDTFSLSGNIQSVQLKWWENFLQWDRVTTDGASQPTRICWNLWPIFYLFLECLGSLLGIAISQLYLSGRDGWGVGVGAKTNSRHQACSFPLDRIWLCSELEAKEMSLVTWQEDWLDWGQLWSIKF